MAIVEADPKDHSVGLGGLPNEDGVVELDAAVMHGPTHGGGSVASIRNIMHPAAVARLVMQRSRHCLLVGEGALRFARAHGFPEVNLLTDDARQIWLHWKETRDPNDDWLPPPDEKVAAFIREALEPSASPARSIARCSTPTATWAARRRPRACPGRSPAASAIRRSSGPGLFLDNEVGSAGSTGVGELNLLNLSSALIVEGMRRGLHPKDAIMEVCKTIATRSHPRPQAAPPGRPSQGQCVVLRGQQGRQVRRRLDLSRRQDGRPRRRFGQARPLRSALRQSAGASTLIDPRNRQGAMPRDMAPDAEIRRKPLDRLIAAVQRA